MHKENVPSIVIGVKTMEQLQDNLGALGWTLSDEEMNELDKVYCTLIGCFSPFFWLATYFLEFFGTLKCVATTCFSYGTPRIDKYRKTFNKFKRFVEFTVLPFKREFLT